jgi:outer membrane lipoprotein-sorting protein
VKYKKIIIVLLMPLLVGCGALFKGVATEYIWKRLAKINNIHARGELKVAGFSQLMNLDFYYLKPRRIGVFFKSPASLKGSVLIYKRGTFVAYNTLDKAALRIKGIPKFDNKERRKLVESLLGLGSEYIKFQRMGIEQVAGRPAEKMSLLIKKPKPHSQQMWMDKQYLFPVKAIFKDPFSGLVSEGEATTLKFNQDVDAKLFKIQIPNNIHLVDFDITKLEKTEPLYKKVTNQYAYQGSVKDKSGSQWIFSSYMKEKPFALFTIHAKNPKVKLPLTGFTQTYMIKGERRYSIPIRGYSLIYYQKKDLHIMAMSNGSYEDLLDLTVQD